MPQKFVRARPVYVVRLLVQTGTWIIAILAVTYACSMAAADAADCCTQAASNWRAVDVGHRGGHHGRTADALPSGRRRDARGGRHLCALGGERRGERLVCGGCRRDAGALVAEHQLAGVHLGGNALHWPATSG